MSVKLTYQVTYADGRQDLVTTRPVDLIAFEAGTGQSLFGMEREGYSEHMRLCWLAATHSAAYPAHLPKPTTLEECSAGVGFSEWSMYVLDMERTEANAADPTPPGHSPGASSSSPSTHDFLSGN